MNTDRIEEIQKETAHPDSVSVQQALLKVWNECEQQKVVNKNDLLPLVSQQRELLVAFKNWYNLGGHLPLLFVEIDEFLSNQ